jgi:hypothetical protein
MCAFKWKETIYYDRDHDGVGGSLKLIEYVRNKEMGPWK